MMIFCAGAMPGISSSEAAGFDVTMRMPNDISSRFWGCALELVGFVGFSGFATGCFGALDVAADFFGACGFAGFVADFFGFVDFADVAADFFGFAADLFDAEADLLTVLAEFAPRGFTAEGCDSEASTCDVSKSAAHSARSDSSSARSRRARSSSSRSAFSARSAWSSARSSAVSGVESDWVI